MEIPAPEMKKSKSIILGSRGSELALCQAETVKKLLKQKHPHLQIQIKTFQTEGDNAASRGKASEPGIFTRGIEAALLQGEIDVAVHSLKDLPVKLRDGLKLAAVPEREDPLDALISNNNTAFEDLPRGAVVMTGSPRRRALTLYHRPDIQVAEVRGNVPTRIEKMSGEGADAVILAYAGLKRLGLQEHACQKLPPDTFLPAPAQGALGVQVRSEDRETEQICRTIDHRHSRLCVTAERAFFSAIGAGCHVPAGALARFEGPDNELRVRVMLASENGSDMLKNDLCRKVEGPKEAESMGRRMGTDLLASGGDKIMKELILFQDFA